MERKLSLELCQRQAIKGGVLVEYGGIACQPYAYELKFQQDGTCDHFEDYAEHRKRIRAKTLMKNEMEAKKE